MKLFIAVSGESKEDVLAKLRLALEKGEFEQEDNCYAPEYDEAGHLLYQVDYQWEDEAGDAMLADLLTK